MKKHEIKNRKRFHIFKDMRFFQRMILIFVIGGILPLLGSSLYMNSQTSKMMINLTKETQSEELALISSSITESMSVLDDVSAQLCKNKEILRLIRTDYPTENAFFRDYYSMSAVTDYLDYYQRDIARIDIYMDNKSISPKNMMVTEWVSYMGDTIRNQTWYQETVKSKSGFWYYDSDPDTNKLSLQISRAIRDDQGEVIAMITVMMQNQKTSEPLDERNADTVLMYKDKQVVYANFDTENKYSGLREKIESSSRKIPIAYSKKLTQGVEEYLLTYEPVREAGYSDYFSLVSIQDYQEIMSDVNRISLRAFVPEVVGIIVSMILIFGFTASYGKRIGLLRLQMHRVAQGEYDKVEPIVGNDEIGEIYLELEQMMKDIQKLMSEVVNEQVQKEKLHTRQKEVEFKMLASQINPHFLYNTLETIRMKAMVNKQPEIVELVKMLAKIMRYNLQVSDRLVTLQSELQMVQYYLKIQNYRFGDRITSSVEVDDDVDLQTMVMPLIIQPFVENAFVHGLEAMDSDGILKVHVCMDGENICITVSDNGEGMDYYELGRLRKSIREEDPDRTHIGVHNVNQRIQIFYGEEYGIRVESRKGGGTKVTICFPKNPKENTLL